jgi:hypothetical protein
MDKASLYYLSQLGCLLLVASFAMPKAKWQRGLAIGAGVVFFLSGFATFPEIDWAPLFWGAAAIAVNAYFLTSKELQEKVAKLRLDPVDNFLAKTALANFPHAELKSFVGIAKEGVLPVNRVLIQSGKKLEYLFCVLEGGVEVRKGGKKITALGAGCFVGEMSLLTKALTRAEVVTSATSKFLVWSHADIDTWVSGDSVRLSILQTALGTQVVEELLRQNQEMHDAMGQAS